MGKDVFILARNSVAIERRRQDHLLTSRLEQFHSSIFLLPTA